MDNSAVCEEKINRTEGLEKPDECRPENIGLPPALEKLRSRQYLLSAAFLVAAVSGAVVLKDPSILLIAAVSVWFAFLAISLEHRYRDGSVSEKILICTSLRKSVVHDTVTVSFQSCDDSQEFFCFQIASRKKAADFIPGASYTVYFDTVNPSRLLTYAAK